MERVLGVLDGAVLVISAVEGVQAQTRVLMRALQRLQIPTLIFVNKIDRRGARHGGLLRNVSEKLTPAIVPMGSPRALGTRSAGFAPYGPTDEDFTARLSEVLADHDDGLLAAFVDDSISVPYDRLHSALAAQTRVALLHPLYFGSARTGVGIDALVAGLTDLLPTDEGDADGPASGVVFKIEGLNGPGLSVESSGLQFAGLFSWSSSCGLAASHCLGVRRDVPLGENPRGVGGPLSPPFEEIYSAHVMRDWRVLYVTDEERRRVTVRDVRHRRDAYRSP